MPEQRRAEGDGRNIEVMERITQLINFVLIYVLSKIIQKKKEKEGKDFDLLGQGFIDKTIFTHI